ncbi:MAG: ABC transporter permease, partial [Acidobacteriota bacterium]|nr:ABC transporter permease [Acidobacteriota bacterium]
MSATGASAPTAPAAPAAGLTAARPWRGRHPHTPTVLRWELRKLVSQKRTYIGLVIGMVLPIIFVVVRNLQSGPAHGDSLFARELTQSGLATPILMLLFESAFFLPLIAALVAGDIVAAEDGNGTLKTILTRSVGRGQVFAAKVI